jgi:hypothetical protein
MIARSPDWLARAFDRAWNWTFDRQADQDDRIRAFCYAHGIAFCPGMGCPSERESPTPLRHVVARQLAPAGWRCYGRARNICDVQDRDVRWRLWWLAHTLVHNWSIRLRANDWPREPEDERARAIRAWRDSPATQEQLSRIGRLNDRLRRS